MRSPQEQAVHVLEEALRRSGAQDAAHTALELARAQAAQTARQQARAAERAAAHLAAVAERRRWEAQPLTPEHARAVQQLDECRAEREQLRIHRDALHSAVQQTREQLEQLPRWAPRRRRALTDTLTSGQQQLRQTDPTFATLDAEIDRLTRQVAHPASQRRANDLSAQHPFRPDTGNLTRPGQPTRPRPAPLDPRELVSMLTRCEPYRGTERDRADGMHR